MDEHGSYKDAMNADTEFALGGGVIRLYPGTVNQTTGNFSGGSGGNPPGPTIHANSAHVSCGLISLDVKGSGAAGGDLVIQHNSPGPIVGISMDLDETLSAYGVGGVSGGAGEMVIRFYEKDTSARLYLHHQDDYDRLAGAFNNLWLFWAAVTHRGTGGPSLRDRMAALESRVTTLEG